MNAHPAFPPPPHNEVSDFADVLLGRQQVISDKSNCIIERFFRDGRCQNHPVKSLHLFSFTSGCY